MNVVTILFSVNEEVEVEAGEEDKSAVMTTEITGTTKATKKEEAAAGKEIREDGAEITGIIEGIIGGMTGIIEGIGIIGGMVEGDGVMGTAETTEVAMEGIRGNIRTGTEDTMIEIVAETDSRWTLDQHTQLSNLRKE